MKRVFRGAQRSRAASVRNLFGRQSVEGDETIRRPLAAWRKTTMRKRLMLLLSVLLSFTLIAAACGDDDDAATAATLVSCSTRAGGDGTFNDAAGFGADKRPPISAFPSTNLKPSPKKTVARTLRRSSRTVTTRSSRSVSPSAMRSHHRRSQPGHVLRLDRRLLRRSQHHHHRLR